MAENSATSNMKLNVVRVALGSAQFGLAYGVANRGGQVSPSKVKMILKAAKSAGVDTVDTAIGYGDSETCLGNLGVTNFRVVTKLPGLPAEISNVASWVENELALSLLRLRLSKVYGLLLHRSSDLSGPHGASLWSTMVELKNRQLIEKIGVSIYDPDELDYLTTNFDIDLVQAPFNLLDRRLSSSGWLDRLKKINVEVHTRSVFLQGLLLMSREEIPSKFERWNGLWDRWHHWLQYSDVTALQACLALPLSCEKIDRVVVGMDSEQQFQQILQVLARPLINNLPDLRCDSKDLINPAIWPSL
jgi:aryl-alcohol dehydrogenase-like predicted oxidoreductase